MPNFGILSLFLERLSVAPLCKIWVPFRRDSAVAHPNGTEPIEFIVPDAAQVCVFSVTSPAHSSLQYSQLPLGIESAGKEHGGKEHGGKELGGRESCCRDSGGRLHFSAESFMAKGLLA